MRKARLDYQQMFHFFTSFHKNVVSKGSSPTLAAASNCLLLLDVVDSSYNHRHVQIRVNRPWNDHFVVEIILF